ncbi:MAG: HEAT repeat domain-containing protein [Sedimentisphaerales bacterium]
MKNKMVVILSCLLFSTLVSAQQADKKLQQLKDDWNDFLHYTVIGRFDLAAGFAQKIIDSNCDPLNLLNLSEENPRGYAILVRIQADNPQLSPLAEKIIEIIEKGRYLRRTDSEIIQDEIKRLSSTVRGRYTAIERLRNSGEYAIPYMLDALVDESRKDEFPNITAALPEIGKEAVRPLTTSLVMDNVVVKAEVIKALGKIGYPESLGYLKYIAENDSSQQLRQLATDNMQLIDSASVKKSAAQLFYELAEKYYDDSESLRPPAEVNSANIWFWDKNDKRLVREQVDKTYFHELMAMRCCEWSLRAEAKFGDSISLWLAAFFRIDNTNIPYPKYFGSGHPDAMTYATTTGAEYLHRALERGIKDKDSAVALGAVEALAQNAGEKSLMFRLKTSQPLINALSFDNNSVKFSAAIAIALAEPAEKFSESVLVTKNLAEAISDKDYAVRACKAMLKLAETRNQVINLSDALSALVSATNDSRDEIKTLSAQILAYLPSPDAQRAIAQMAIKEENKMEVRIDAFGSLAVSAKVNANLLLDEQIDKIYSIVQSIDVNAELRSSAAAAFGALNLPSQKVKDLILNQAKI